MKTQVEVLPDNQAKLVITVEAAEVNKRIKKTYKDFAHKYNFPGFRAGKAPRPVIDNALGNLAVAATVTEELVHETYPLAVDENNLFTIGQPKIEEEDLIAHEGEDLVYTAVVDLTPEFELSSYEPVEIELPIKEATDKEVEDQIEQLREYYFEFKESGPTAKVKKINFVELTISAKDAEGNEIEALNADHRLYEMGSGLFPAAFDEELIGLKKANDKEFSIDLAEEPSMLSTSLGDKAGVVTFNVTVEAIKTKVLPEVTDEWVKEVIGFEDVEDLKKNVKETIEAQKLGLVARMKESQCLYALQERLEGEAPEALCEEEERNALQNFFTQLQEQGMTLDVWMAQQGITADQFKEDIKHQAKDIATQDLAIDAWARHANIEVTDEDVKNEFKQYAGDKAAEFEAEWRANGQIHMLRRSIARTRAVAEIMDSAVVTEIEPKQD